MGTTAAGAGVHWVGALRTVLAGDLGSRISLERLARSSAISAAE